jgi:hypothetical protein
MNIRIRPIYTAACAGVLFCFVGGGTPLFAESVVGTVTTVMGKAYVTSAGSQEVILVKKGAETHFLDTYETKSKSRLKILFEDDSIINLGENSKILITEDLYDPGQNQRSRVIDMASGSMRVLVGKGFLSKGSKFEVHTPTAMAAARGTYFTAWVSDGKSGLTSGVLVIEGDVDVVPFVGTSVATPGGGVPALGEAGPISLKQGEMLLVGGAGAEPVQQATPEFIAERMKATDIPARVDHTELAVGEGQEASGNRLSFLSPDFLREGAQGEVKEVVQEKLREAARDAFAERLSEQKSAPLAGHEILNQEVLKAHILIDIPIPNNRSAIAFSP